MGYIASMECQPRTRYTKNLAHALTYGGTAVVSSCYVRPDRFSFPQDVRNTTRLLSTFLHLGGSQVLVITIYLPPKRHDDRFVCQSGLEPLHLNGDFHDMSRWVDLELMGWTEVGESILQREARRNSKIFCKAPEPVTGSRAG